MDEKMVNPEEPPKEKEALGSEAAENLNDVSGTGLHENEPEGDPYSEADAAGITDTGDTADTDAEETAGADNENNDVDTEKAEYLIGEIIAESMSEVDFVADADSEDERERIENEKRASRLEIYDWIQCVVSTLIFVVLAFIFIGRQIGVDGTSMRDTLYNEDSVFVTNILYTPKTGDIIILKVDSFSEKPLVKRVIATGGQTVDINFDTHEVIVDGVVLNEPYIKEPTANRLDFSGPVTVPEGCVFVMGDNRNASTDSRDSNIGFVDERSILGKVRFILMPGEDAFGTRDWSRLGSVYRTTP